MQLPYLKVASAELNKLSAASHTARVVGSIDVYFHRFEVATVIRNSSAFYDALRDFVSRYYPLLWMRKEPRELRNLGYFEARSEIRKKRGVKKQYFIIDWIVDRYVVSFETTRVGPDSSADITIKVLGLHDDPFSIQVKRRRTEYYTFTWLNAYGTGSYSSVREAAVIVLSLVLNKLLVPLGYEVEIDFDSLKWEKKQAELWVLYENSVDSEGRSAEERVKEALMLAWKLWGIPAKSRMADFWVGFGKNKGGNEVIPWTSGVFKVDFVRMFVKSYKKKSWREFEGSREYNKLEVKVSFGKSKIGNERVPEEAVIEAAAAFIASILYYARVKAAVPEQGMFKLESVKASPRLDIIKALEDKEIERDYEIFARVVNKYKGQLDELDLALLEFIAKNGIVSSKDLREFANTRKFILKKRYTHPSPSTIKRRMQKLSKLGLIISHRGGGTGETRNVWYYSFNAGASFRDIVESWRVKESRRRKIKGDFEKVKEYLISKGYSRDKVEKAALIYVLIADGGARSSKAILNALNKMGIKIEARTVREYLKDLKRYGLIYDRERYRKRRGDGRKVRHVFYYANPIPSSGAASTMLAAQKDVGG